MRRWEDEQAHQNSLIRAFYAKMMRVSEFPHNQVGWQSQDSQYRRFSALTQGLDPQADMSILDIGSGLGALYGYLQEHDFKASYRGLDLCPQFIQQARDLYPDIAFDCGDVFDLPHTPCADHVLASGAFSLIVPDQLTYLKTALTLMRDLARVSVRFNVLTQHTPQADRLTVFYYYDPDLIIDLCSDMGGTVTPITGYLPNDMSVIVDLST